MTPEQEELERKKLELQSLEGKLLEKELAVATLAAEIGTFQARFEQRMGPLYTKIDELRAAIAEREADLDSKNEVKRAKASKLREQATETSQNSPTSTPIESTTFVPSEELKKLYRDVAKKLHPDLGDPMDEAGRLKRTELMAKVNAAYAKGDIGALKKILEEWENSAESIKGVDEGAELIRTIRKIAQIRRRLEEIESELSALKVSSQAQLMTKLLDSDSPREDPFQELVMKAESQIRILKEQLERKKTAGGVKNG